MNTNPSKPSTAYYVQAITSFSVALAVLIIGVISLPLPLWTRGFFALGTLFMVSSCFNLAKCVRDRQDTESVVSRLDQARIERLLGEFDPYRVPNITGALPSDQPGMASGPLAADQPGVAYSPLPPTPYTPNH